MKKRPMKIKVYRCLKPDLRHRRVYSIMHKGRVVAQHDGATHAALYLLCPKLIVREAGRQRVLRHKRKNVHAMVSGFLALRGVPPLGRWLRVTYNPYAAPTFTLVRSGRPVRAASAAKLDHGNVYVCNPA